MLTASAYCALIQDTVPSHYVGTACGLIDAWDRELCGPICAYAHRIHHSRDWYVRRSIRGHWGAGRRRGTCGLVVRQRTVCKHRHGSSCRTLNKVKPVDLEAVARILSSAVLNAALSISASDEPGTLLPRRSTH